MVRTHRLNVSTDDGLYQVQSNGSTSIRALGLRGCGGVRACIADKDDPRRLYAATGKEGVFLSEDGGATWRPVNEGIVYKNVWSLAQHPATGELYAGTEPTSVFKSADRGETWTDCEQLRSLPGTKDWTFPRPPHISHVRGLALCAQDPAVVCGAIEEGWLLLSGDGGQTWENVREGVEFDAHSVTYLPDDPATLLATTGRGVFKSVDGGRSFVKLEQGLDRRYMAQLVVHPKRPNVLFTAGAAVPPPQFFRKPEGADSAFYRSEDRGQSWTKLHGGLPELITAARGPRPATPKTKTRSSWA
jgi:hypothetical protein